MNNWIDYELFLLYIYIHERFSRAYVIPVPMFPLFSWFLYCSTCSKSTRSMKPNGNISTECAKVLSFVWEKELFHREVICFLINNLFRNVFQTSRVIGLTMLLYVKLLEKVFSSLTVHRKPSFHNFRIISIF